MQNNIADGVLRAAQKVHGMIAKRAEAIGLTPRQIDILLLLADEPDISQSEMMGRCSIDRSTLSNVVRLMQKKGLLARTVSEIDTRAKINTLTTAGRAKVKQARKLRDDVEAELVERLGPARVNMFRKLSDVLIEEER